MGERTDADILSRKPVDVVLGERTFAIKPEARGKSREFRKVFQDKTSGLTTDEMNNLEKQDDLIDLIYLYSKELAENKDYIEENATDKQVVVAFTTIMGLAFGPFVKELPDALGEVFGAGVVAAAIRAGLPGSPSATKPE